MAGPVVPAVVPAVAVHVVVSIDGVTVVALEAELLASLVLVNKVKVVPAGFDDLSMSQVKLIHETILLTEVL